MPLRLIEILTPDSRSEELEKLLDELDTRELWCQDAGGNRDLFRVLVDTSLSEKVLDAVADLLEGEEGARALILAVEAVVPSPEQEEQERDEPGEEKKEEGESSKPRISREELLADLSSGYQVGGLYLATVALSTIVAGIGLLRNDVAVVIGAMVIAPLLAPNMALALAATLADWKLALRALTANAAGLLLALTLATVMGLLFPVDTVGTEIARRTLVGGQDVILALAAGAAGALALTSGIQTSLIGVMVAVALLPPLVNLGLLLGEGEPRLAWGAFLLVSVNVVCVNLAGVVTFLVQGIGPRGWWKANRAKSSARLAILLWLTLLLLVVLLFWTVR